MRVCLCRMRVLVLGGTAWLGGRGRPLGAGAGARRDLPRRGAERAPAPVGCDASWPRTGAGPTPTAASAAQAGTSCVDVAGSPARSGGALDGARRPGRAVGLRRPPARSMRTTPRPGARTRAAAAAAARGRTRRPPEEYGAAQGRLRAAVHRGRRRPAPGRQGRPHRRVRRPQRPVRLLARPVRAGRRRTAARCSCPERTDRPAPVRRRPRPRRLARRRGAARRHRAVDASGPRRMLARRSWRPRASGAGFTGEEVPVSDEVAAGRRGRGVHGTAVAAAVARRPGLGRVLAHGPARPPPQPG